MRKIVLTILVALSSGIATFSQSLSDGFYRVRNYSNHYIFIRDCTGSATSKENQDVDAVELWNWDESILSDPSSIMYVTNISGSDYNVESQNTSIKKILNQTPQFSTTHGYWAVYCAGCYLFDIGSDKSNPGSNYSSKRTYPLATNDGDMAGKPLYKFWGISSVDNSTSDNYFGLKPTVTTNSKYYAPFYAAFAYTPVNNDVKTWYVTKVDKDYGIAVISEITGTVAASQPVIIECAGSSSADNKVDLTADAGKSASSNKLNGVYFCNEERVNKDHSGKDPALVTFDNATMRVLGTDDDGNLAFVNNSSNLVSTSSHGSCIPHNTSYLTVDKDCPATLKVMTESEYETYKKGHETNITEVKSSNNTGNSKIYDIQGRSVPKNDSYQSSGIYIINGKKIIK